MGPFYALVRVHFAVIFSPGGYLEGPRSDVDEGSGGPSGSALKLFGAVHTVLVLRIRPLKFSSIISRFVSTMGCCTVLRNEVALVEGGALGVAFIARCFNYGI